MTTSSETPTFSGDLLRAARNAKGFSQSQLARAIGAHVTSVSDWERGANAPSRRYVRALARRLEIKAEELFAEVAA